jgi:hypothetical protein
MTEYDHTEKVERTDVGVRMYVESKRGTGTRDQDKVTLEYRGEELPDETTVTQLHARVSYLMDLRRTHQPDEANDE